MILFAQYLLERLLNRFQHPLGNFFKEPTIYSIDIFDLESNIEIKNIAIERFDFSDSSSDTVLIDDCEIDTIILNNIRVNESIQFELCNKPLMKRFAKEDLMKKSRKLLSINCCNLGSKLKFIHTNLKNHCLGLAKSDIRETVFISSQLPVKGIHSTTFVL